MDARMSRYSPILLLALATTSLCTADESKFAGGLYPVLQKANCRACHVDGGIASATRLHFPEVDAPPAQIEAFGRSLTPLVNRDQPEASLLYTKPTNSTKHTGGKLIAPGSPEEALLLDWVRYLARANPTSNIQNPTSNLAVPTVMRRLTHSQYNHTVRDLLGDQTSPANQFPPEDFVNGFQNQADAQSIPALLEEAYSAAAEKLARNAFRGGDTNGLISCKQDEKCRGQFVREFGLKAFRQPLRAKEVERYSRLFAGQKDFVSGAQLVVEAMLQSPNFLFRVERGGGAKAYEIASRLSYFLWDTMPDSALFRGAAAGELDTKVGVEKIARRMVADPRAKEALNQFVTQWLRFDRLLNTVKDRAEFPMFNPELAAAMTEETLRLVSDAVWNDRDFMTVFRSDYGFLNSDLANLYKFPAPPGEFQRVQFPADSDRAGLLGEATFLALTSKPADTSPTARGLFVREQFLCQHVPDPPPGTNSNLPPLTESKPQTNRDRLSAHLTSPVCASCHRLIDPIGFGFEKFDAIGGRRDKLTLTFRGGRQERNKQPAKAVLELDTSGEISGLPNSGFHSPKEIGRVLAESGECQQCVVKQLFRFAFARPETVADRPVIESAFNKFRDSQFRFKELMVALAVAQSEP
jgi:hypothetical protein